MTFKEFYTKEVKPKLMKDLGIKNTMAVPRIQKIVVNVGAGEALANKNVIGKIQEQLEVITGQRSVVTKAKKSISAFKVRKGFPIGVKVTLRNEKMYIFLEKIVKVTIPRLKDFKGISESAVDSHGNLNLGFPEQTIFHEVDFDMIDKVRGLQVTVVTTAGSKENGKKLFELIGIPFKAE